jgi:hypothetical protein
LGGLDPYDGLFFAWPAWLTGGHHRRQVIVQRTPARRSTSAGFIDASIRGSPRRWGCSARSAMRLSRGGDPDAAALALAALDLLDADRTAGGAAWGPWCLADAALALSS